VKRLGDGRAMVNLGSSARVADGWNNVDSSWLFRLARHRHLARLLHGLGLLSAPRWDRICKLGNNFVLYDIVQGIPYDDASFDVVYHSHLLEHIDREGAEGFLIECRRVLKPTGVLRIVVPDLELLARRYVDLLDGPVPDRASRLLGAASDLFDQMVNRTPRYRRQQKWIVRMAESALIGNTARAGVIHRWMYDRFTLEEVLRRAGFIDMTVCSAHTSRIEGWNTFGLDTEPDGSVYKAHSLYMEAVRPSES
jgi:SAM-dependent methyltransferase